VLWKNKQNFYSLTSIWCVCFGTKFWLARRSSWELSPGPRGRRTTDICACWTSPRAVKSDFAWTKYVAFSSWVASGSGTDVQCAGCPKVHQHNLYHIRHTYISWLLFFYTPITWTFSYFSLFNFNTAVEAEYNVPTSVC